MAKKNAIPENERCRGKWSKCGGTEPALSATWHLGAECTKAYRAMKKAEAAAKPKPAKEAPKASGKKAATKDATPRSAGSSPATVGTAKPRVPKNSGAAVRRSTPPAPPRVPVARVNAPEQAPHMVMLVAPSDD